jgi:rhodanese-related sulfurtransferase
MTATRRLAMGALGLGLAAPFAGSPFRAAHGRLDVEDAARAIQTGEDHVEPLQLAAWIRARKPGLRVIDVREPQDFGDDAIATAENIPLGRLISTPFAPGETLVLYSEGGAHAGQAWVLLRAIGVRNAYFIRGGLVDWFTEVLSPTLPDNATPEQKAAFDKAAELSHYFGGDPQVGSPAAIASQSRSASRSAPQSLRRRGC